MKKEKIDSNKQPISWYYLRIGHKQDNGGQSPYGAAIFQSVSISMYAHQSSPNWPAFLIVKRLLLAWES
nr:hypothetical protein [Tanacetum cinerariifolium]